MKRLPPVEKLRRLFTLCDDGSLLWNWVEEWPRNINGRLAGKVAGSEDGKGHRHVNVGGQFYQAHRVVWALHTGEDPFPHDIDHINGVRNDNRPGNLRLAGKALNVLNGRPRGRLKVKGVYERRPGRFVAQTKHNGRPLYLGTYDSPELAHEAYCLVADMIHGAGAYAR